MVGINRWKMANDPMYRVAEKNRKIWEKESGEELVYEWEPDDSNDFCTDPIYSNFACNIHHHHHHHHYDD